MKGKTSLAFLVLLTVSALAFYVVAQNRPEQLQEQKQKMVRGMVQQSPVAVESQAGIRGTFKPHRHIEYDNPFGHKPSPANITAYGAPIAGISTDFDINPPIGSQTRGARHQKRLPGIEPSMLNLHHQLLVKSASKL